MITIIFGKPGVGKSAYMTSLAAQWMYPTAQQQDYYNDTCRHVAALRTDGHNVSYPAHVPIYSNYSIRVPYGYRQFTKSYWIDGYHMGFEHGDPKKNKGDRVVHVLKGSKVFLMEGQRYYDSRRPKEKVPDWVCRWYEQHRHFGLEITIDVQRPVLIDTNIRELCSRFVLVEGFSQKTDKHGFVCSTTFKFKEFDDWKYADAFIDGAKNNNYVEKTETFNFDVFECYNSFSYEHNFLPPKDKDFYLLENFDFLDGSLDLDLAKRMYAQAAPEGYWQR